MRDVAQLETQQIRIFPSDKVPFVELIAPAMSETFAQRLGGAKFVPGQGGEVSFVGGTIFSEDGRLGNVIKVVQLTDRKVSVTVQGASAVAQRAYGMIEAFMSEIGHAPGPPLTLTDATACVVTLDFDWTDLIDPRVSTFVTETFARVLGDRTKVEPELRNVGLSFGFGFSRVPESLGQHGITLSDKTLTIEPRNRTPLAQRRYFTNSPTDSDTHLELLQQLEGTLAPTRALPVGPKVALSRTRGGAGRSKRLKAR